MVSFSKPYNYPEIAPVTDRLHRPFWSVMIPTYNNSKYLKQAIESILEQDLAPDEMQIEVIDDCSTKDDPEKLVREVGNNRVSFYRQPQNVGIGANWNTCIQKARGHWIHILHQDDLVMPGFYRRFREALEYEPTIGAAFCRNIYVDEDGNWQSLSPLERKTPGILSAWIEKIAVACWIVCPAIVVKRSVYEQLGGFHPEFKCALDWDMWKRIALHYPIWYEPQPLACYRWHSASTLSGMISSGFNVAEARKSIELFHSYLPEAIADELSEKSREHHAIFALHLAQQLLAGGKVAAVIAQIREGLKCSNSSAVMKSLASLLTLPESEPLLRVLASLFISIEPDQLLSALSDRTDSSQPEGINIRLKDINLIIFPDWKQPEDLLYQDLVGPLKSLATHPERNQMTLSIDTSNISDEEVNIVLSGVVMNVLLQEDLDITEGLEVFLLGNLEKSQWEALLPWLHWRIVLEHENTQGILEASAENIPSCELDDLSNLRTDKRFSFPSTP
jgi:hypothetical protein